MSKRVVQSGGSVVCFDTVDWELYRKRPVTVHAIQMQRPFDVQTLEGVMHGNAGDWLIEGVSGELYPCKPDIFAKTYEEAT
jgi:hypothetical protein